MVGLVVVGVVNDPLVAAEASEDDVAGRPAFSSDLSADPSRSPSFTLSPESR
jgi:hypothetical protein